MVATYLRTNWDAATVAFSQSIGLGGIARNSDGEIIDVICSQLSYLLKPETAKTLALRKAMTMCWKLNVLTVIFEGDYQCIVFVVKRAWSCADELNPILYDIRFMLQYVKGWSISYVSRGVNQLTHKFAKLALFI